MHCATLLLLAGASVLATTLAVGQYYVPRAYYTIDDRGHESAPRPVPLRRLRRSLHTGPLFAAAPDHHQHHSPARATANANANAVSSGGGDASASANARASSAGGGDVGWYPAGGTGFYPARHHGGYGSVHPGYQYHR